MNDTIREPNPISDIAAFFGITLFLTGAHFLLLYSYPITTYANIFFISIGITVLAFFLYIGKVPSCLPAIEIYILLLFAINIGFGLFNIKTNEEMERVLSSKILNFEDYSVVIRFSDDQLKAGIEKHNKDVNNQKEYDRRAKEKEKIEAEKLKANLK